jgi:hypothetical protein
MLRFISTLIATLFFVAVGVIDASEGQADIVVFKLTGVAGEGLLGGNVTNAPPTDAGSGGMGPTGLQLDTDMNILHIDIEWGSDNGYSDMSGLVTMVHLHGLTDDPAPQSFNQISTNILVNVGQLGVFNNSPTDGSVTGNFFLADADVAGLLEGRTYLNVHTNLNSMGEIRGYLVVVPEPGLMGPAAFLFLVVAAGVRWPRMSQNSYSG